MFTCTQACTCHAYLTCCSGIDTHHSTVRFNPAAHELALVPDADEQTPDNLLALDLEGRVLVLNFGLFVLINLYCPNEGSDARFPYKMNYHLMLQECVRGLIAAGREVVVVSDLNVCAAPIDHCDGHLPSNASTFWDYPARAWMQGWLAPIGPARRVYMLCSARK